MGVGSQCTTGPGDRGGERPGLMLGLIVLVTDDQALPGPSVGGLLEHVYELVAEQLSAGRRGWPILAGSEQDV